MTSQPGGLIVVGREPEGRIAVSSQHAAVALVAGEGVANTVAMPCPCSRSSAAMEGLDALIGRLPEAYR